MDKEKTWYQRQLADPRWQKRRLEILSRDSFKCRICSATDKELQIHHCFYDKGMDVWEYEDDCYVTLCHECHEIETKSSSLLLNQITDELKRKGYLFVDLLDVLNFFKSTEPKQFGTMQWIMGVSKTIKDHGYDTVGWLNEKLDNIFPHTEDSNDSETNG